MYILSATVSDLFFKKGQNVQKLRLCYRTTFVLPFSLHLDITALHMHVQISHGIWGINQITKIHSKICILTFRMQSNLTTTLQKHEPTFKSELLSVCMLTFN